MLTDWREQSLGDLLRRHGLDGSPEQPFPHDGWSGAALTALERGSERFVVKRTSWATDWIVRATRDRAIREGWVAANVSLGPGLVAPYLGAAADGDAVALVMPDLSTELIPWDRPGLHQVIGPSVVDRVMGAMARLHLEDWGEGLPWCPLEDRLLLLARPSAERYVAQGLPVGERFLAGWDAFDRWAPAPARQLVDRLSRDPAPLIAALGRLPEVSLHGDLKLANVALLDVDVALIDWQMACRAPVPVELGWFLVSNVALLPEGPEPIVGRYREAVRSSGNGGYAGGASRDARLLGDWAAQVDLTWIVGLLLRGWRKGLDAASETPTGWGTSAADDLAWWCARAIEAADRRL